MTALITSRKVNYIRPSDKLVVEKNSGICEACGGYGPFRYETIITEQLAREWSLSKLERRAFSSRESMFCSFCGCSYRLRALAKAIVIETNNNPKLSLEKLIKDTQLKNYKIAEINSCGVLHNILRNTKNLYYSEYMPSDKAIRNEDLNSLSYKDGTFDIVLNSDTLEHVPNPEKALNEVYRTLKNGGKHIFTIPMRLDKKTKIRTKMVNDKMEYIESPSYHGSGEPDYLVWNEFGGDFIDLLEKIGFQTKLYFQNVCLFNDPSCVIVSTKKDKSHPPRSNEIYIDSRFKDYFNKNKATFDSRGVNFKFIDIEQDINLSLQAEKVQELYNKVILTQEHASNLQDMLAGYEKENAEQKTHLANLQEAIQNRDNEIQAFRKSIGGKVYRVGRKVKKVNISSAKKK